MNIVVFVFVADLTRPPGAIWTRVFGWSSLAAPNQKLLAPLTMTHKLLPVWLCSRILWGQFIFTSKKLSWSPHTDATPSNLQFAPSGAPQVHTTPNVSHVHFFGQLWHGQDYHVRTHTNPNSMSHTIDVRVCGCVCNYGGFVLPMDIQLS